MNGSHARRSAPKKVIVNLALVRRCAEVLEEMHSEEFSRFTWDQTQRLERTLKRLLREEEIRAAVAKSLAARQAPAGDSLAARLRAVA
jgi:hypothetical protein